MAKQFASRVLGNWGLDNLDSEHALAEQYAVISKDVVVSPGKVESRNGTTLWNADATGRTGGITSMTPAYFRGGTKQLIFSNDDDWFYLTNAATPTTAWTSIGDFGTTTTNPSSFFSRNAIIMGTGIEANTPKKWDGSSWTNVTTPADASSDTRFFEYHQSKNIAYTFTAGNPRDNASHNNSILYYTTDLDNWGTGGTINVGTNDGQEITGIKSHGNLLVYKDNSKYKLDSVYESNSGTNILRVLERYQDGGAVNNEVIQVVLNDVIALSGRPGEGIRGFQQTQTQLGGSESRRFSTKLKPYLDLINWQVVKKTARSIVWDEKYFLALPISGSSTNNIVLVGHLDQVTDIGEIPWTVFDMNVGSFAIFQDSNSVEKLLIGDSELPKIYTWDPKSLTDNQTNISPQFRTKRFDLGDMGIDDLHTIVVAGQMSEPTELKCKVFADGKETVYVIKKEQLLNASEYIWSHVVGSEVVGGNKTSAAKPRYLAILSLPDSHRTSSEVQFDFSFSGQGMYFSVDYLGINVDYNLRKFADTHNVSASN